MGLFKENWFQPISKILLQDDVSGKQKFALVRVLAFISVSLFAYAWLANYFNWYSCKPFLLYYFAEATIIAVILSRLGIKQWVILLLLASTLLQVHFLFISDINYIAPDIEGHKDYIYYLVQNVFVPPPPSGWQRQQPPLYYEWCALAFKAGQLLHLSDPWWAVRIASRSMYLGYLVFSVLLLDRFRFPFLAQISALSIILFWPCVALISNRINSDIGFIFFFMGSLLYLQHWYEKSDRRSLHITVIYAGLSLLCKGTGVITMVMVATVIIHALIVRRITYRYFFHKSFMWSFVILLMCLTGYFGRIGYYNWVANANLYWFANIHLGEVAYTPARPYQLVYFNIKDFIQNPVLSFHAVDKNLYTFWDGLFRTLLYDIEIVSEPINLIGTINILWVAVFLLCVRQIILYLAQFPRHREYAVVIIAFCALILITMSEHMIIADKWMYAGRRIHCLIPIVAILTAATLKKQGDAGNTLLYLLFSMICLGFAASSIVLVTYNHPFF